MTAEELAVVRTFCDAVVAGDLTRASGTLDPDVVCFGTRGGLDQDRVFRGPEAFAAYMAEIGDPWERLEFDVERLIDADEAVVVFWHETGQARHADLEVENDTAMIFKVRLGKIVEVRGYLDRDEALQAARPTE